MYAIDWSWSLSRGFVPHIGHGFREKSLVLFGISGSLFANIRNHFCSLQAWYHTSFLQRFRHSPLSFWKRRSFFFVCGCVACEQNLLCWWDCNLTTLCARICYFHPPSISNMGTIRANLREAKCVLPRIGALVLWVIQFLIYDVCFGWLTRVFFFNLQEYMKVCTESWLPSGN